MSETYAIELKNITKRFGKVTANDKVCLSVKKGEIDHSYEYDIRYLLSG